MSSQQSAKYYINWFAWGDLLYHFWQHIHGPKPSEWYVFSIFPEMERFLKHQPGVNYAKHFPLKVPIDVTGCYFDPNWNSLVPEQQARVLARNVNLPDDLPVEIPSQTLSNNHQPWYGAVLPQEELLYAQALIEEVRRKYPGKRLVLAHPYSFNHLPMESHWPHIREAWDWLLEHTDDVFILTGQQNALSEHPTLKADLPIPPDRVHDLTEKLPTALHLFALSNKCDFILTTSNCLSCWATNQHLPCLSWCDRQCTSDNPFWHWHTEHPFILWKEPFARFPHMYEVLKRNKAMNNYFLDVMEKVEDLSTRRFAWLHYGIIHALRPKVILETGTAFGFITAFLAQAAKEINSMVYSIDINLDYGRRTQTLIDTLGLSDYIEIIPGENSISAIRRLGEEGKLDGLSLAILDSDHSYSYITAEIQALWTYLTEGGLVGGHDTLLKDYQEIANAMSDAANAYSAQSFWFAGSHGFTYLQKPYAQLPFLGVWEGEVRSLSDKMERV